MKITSRAIPTKENKDTQSEAQADHVLAATAISHMQRRRKEKDGRPNPSPCEILLQSGQSNYIWGKRINNEEQSVWMTISKGDRTYS